jgi:hypothetical protein
MTEVAGLELGGLVDAGEGKARLLAVEGTGGPGARAGTGNVVRHDTLPEVVSGARPRAAYVGLS